MRGVALAKHRNWKLFDAYVTAEARDLALVQLKKEAKNQTLKKVWQYRAKDYKVK